MRRIGRKNRNLLLVGMAAICLSACGGGKSDAGQAMVQETMAVSRAANLAAGMPMNLAAEEAAVDSDAIMTKGESGFDGGLSAEAVTPQKPDASRKRIRNAELNVETDRFDEMIQAVYARTEELGGYVENSDISGKSSYRGNVPVPRNAYLVLRIPVEKLDQMIDEVEKGGNVINRMETIEDITLQYTDLESRKKTLSVEQDRIWELLEKADTLESVIALEERLSEIRYELESMESQLRLYDSQVAYSTLRLRIQEILEPSSFTPVEPEGIGERISKGLRATLTAMKQAGADLIVFLAVTSPIWIPAAVILAAGFRIVRTVRKKKKMKADPSEEQKSVQEISDSKTEQESK